MSNAKSLPNLPNSKDEFWQEAEVYTAHPVNIPICSTHSKQNWTTHKGYNDNHDGTISCQYCPFGARINTGWYRVLNGEIVDLRNPSSRHS
jgi:hypothetical protein